MHRWIVGIQSWFLSLNFFVDGSTNEETIRKQKFSTKLFIILFTTSLIILVFYSALENQATLVTISNPSYATFELLSQLYLQTLNCPCVNSATEYSKSIQSNFTLHQVWIKYSIEIWKLEIYAYIYQSQNFRNNGDRDFKVLFVSLIIIKYFW